MYSVTSQALYKVKYYYFYNQRRGECSPKWRCVHAGRLWCSTEDPYRQTQKMWSDGGPKQAPCYAPNKLLAELSEEKRSGMIEMNVNILRENFNSVNISSQFFVWPLIYNDFLREQCKWNYGFFFCELHPSFSPVPSQEKVVGHQRACNVGMQHLSSTLYQWQKIQHISCYIQKYSYTINVIQRGGILRKLNLG